MPETPAVTRLAIVNDYDLVVAGVASMLAEERQRVRVVELDTTHDDLTGVDVILYDTFGPAHSSMDTLEELISRSTVPVIVYTWKLSPWLAEEAIARGAAGYLSKALTGAQIVDAIDSVIRGEVVVSPEVIPAEVLVGGDWPGRALADLSPRESEVIAMIALGLSNQEIADRSYLSINSVKSYVRSAYRKIGLRSRTQVVRWALDNGFRTEAMASAETADTPPEALA
jgi:NarL family two-component system response regulator LiaR